MRQTSTLPLWIVVSLSAFFLTQTDIGITSQRNFFPSDKASYIIIFIIFIRHLISSLWKCPDWKSVRCRHRGEAGDAGPQKTPRRDETTRDEPRRATQRHDTTRHATTRHACMHAVVISPRFRSWGVSSPARQGGRWVESDVEG